MKMKYLLMAALMAMPCVMFTACGSDDDENSGTKIPVEEQNGQGQKTTNTDILKDIDSGFKADLAYLQKTWHGVYEGWDDVQKKNTTISRDLTLYANGNYKNIIAGKLIDSGKEDFFKFEAEGGTYTYNASTGVVTYKVEYDSVLNYNDQTYTKYTKKHYYDHENATYTEKADFSTINEGNRRWITMDMYLQSLTNKTINIAFGMDPAKK